VNRVQNPTAGNGDYKTAVLAATDLVQLVGASVKLARKGRDFWGCCPFHSEKSPSFKVSPEKQFFYCFGCKEKGNAIDFVMKRDRVEFIDALRTLGEAANIEMPRSGASKEKTSERQALLDAHSAAAAFYEKCLVDPERGAAARQYLDKRGITDESIKRFRIGLAPDAWDGLLKGPAGRKFAPPLLATAGLVKRRDKGDGFYDTFRNRLMFPIRDESGRVIAFGGRVTPGSQDPAKYLNSPETPLFSKSRCVFGLDLAKQKIVDTRTAVVVEGYTDVVVAHQFGVSNVVSVLGTAMTEQHLAALRRFADKIVLLFDADSAGDTAVDRAVGLFLTQPVEIFIASMPPETDPDEFLIREGAEEFQRLLSSASDALTYKWKQLVRRFESSNDLTARQKAVEEYLQMLADARGSGPVDPLRWGQALARVSRLTEIPVEELNRRFASAKNPPPRRFDFGGPGGGGKPVRPGNGGPGGQGPGVALEAPTPPRPLDGSARAEQWILGILLLEPHRWMRVQKTVHVEDFGDPLNRRLAELYWDRQRNEGEPVFNEFLGELGGFDPALVDRAMQAVDEIEQLGGSEAGADDHAEDRPDRDQTLREAIAHIEHARARREDQKLLAELRRTSLDRRDAQGTVPLDQGKKQDKERGSVSADDDVEVALLRQLQEKARRPDLRRV
jgi:DNA primase